MATATTDLSLFRDAIRRHAWAYVALTVRPFCRTRTTADGADILRDWLADGCWVGDETPERIAAEWDNFS